MIAHHPRQLRRVKPMNKHDESTGLRLSRRNLLRVGAGAAAACGIREAAAQAANPMVPVPLPTQAPAKEGQANIPGTMLFYWDTGGDGVPIILAHPASGSA